MEDYNRQYFSKADVEKDLHIKFMAFLLNNFESEEYKLDLHAYHDDCGAIVVEWVRVLWNHEDEMGRFEFVGEGDEVLRAEDSDSLDRAREFAAETAEQITEHLNNLNKKR